MFIRNFLVVIFFVIFFSSAVFSEEVFTEDQLLIRKAQHTDFVESDKYLEGIYNKIIKAFDCDKEFIQQLKNDKQTYFNQRDTMRDMVLTEKPVFYNNSYNFYSEMYFIELNDQKIKFLENAVNSYCFFKHDKPLSCKQEKIKKIFN